MKQETIPERAPMSIGAEPPSNPSVDSATLELLARWRCEDATEDAREMQTAQDELNEFKRAMNESRTLAGQSPLYP